MKPTFPSTQIPRKQHQTGAIMVIGLVTMLILTIIGLYASRASNMGTIMATNAQHVSQALAAAENSVQFAERRIVTEFGGAPPFPLDDDKTDGLYGVGTLDITTLDWDATNGIERDLDDAGNLIAEYVIEYVQAGSVGADMCSGCGATASNAYIYRISGRGLAPRGGARIVQSIYLISD